MIDKNKKIDINNLIGVEKTLLIPLWVRAKNTLSQTNEFNDWHAVEIINSIDFDFNLFEKVNFIEKKFTLLGIGIRSKIMDDILIDFLNKYPNSIIINIGCGLDSRAFRLHNNKCQWFDIDLPEVIELRRNYFEESQNYKMIGKSILDYNWIEQINTENKKILIYSIGTLMYFEETEVKLILKNIAKNFSNAELYLDILGTWGVGIIHPSIKALGLKIKYTWGLSHFAFIETWDDKIKYIDFMSMLDYQKKEWGLISFITTFFPNLKRKIASAIVHYSI